MSEKPTYEELAQKVRELEKMAVEGVQAQAALQESEEKYRTILESIEDGYYEINIAGDFTFFNDSARRIYGYPGDKLMGMNNREYMSAETAKRIYKAFNNVYKTGKPTKIFENEIIREDGTKRYLETSVSLRKDSEGKRIGFQGIVRDVTERKRMETELIQTKKFLQNILDSSIDGIASTDLEGNIVYPSSKAKEILGYEREELVGKKVYFYYENGKEDAKKIMKALKAKDELRNHEMRLKKKDGELIDINLSASYLKNEKGEVIGTLGIYRDITETKRLETQLQQAQKMESIGTLAGGIAHDFNNILFPIVGYAEIIMDDMPENSKAHRNLKQILSSALRARDLVQQILTFSRKHDKELKPLKVQLVLREALKLIRSSLPTTIGISQNVDKDCGLIMADPTEIHQVVMNLCTNAYHAMEDTGGSLEVSLNQVKLTVDDLSGLDMEPGQYLCLKVGDNGHGMDQSVIDRIFDPYFTTKETGKGTGLGLAVVHGIVKSCGGDILVYSEPGKGTVFHVYLPRISETSVSSETVSDEVLQTGHEHILLVDDEEIVVSVEKQMLERLGYKVTVRTSSIEALEAFREQPEKFDIVITDMTMPNITGDRLAGELMKIRPDISVILCTGFSERISKERADTLGIKGFLMKPIVMKDLAKTIREALDDIDRDD